MRTRHVATLTVAALLAASCGGDESSDSTDPPESDATEASDETAASGTSESDDTTGEDGDDAATGVVTILGSGTGPNAEGIQAAFEPFTERTGIEIAYSGNRDATTELNLSVEAGDPPDVALIPQPGRTLAFAADDHAKPIPDDILERVRDNYDPFWFDLVTQDGQVYGVPAKGEVKSLVWYNPQVFDERGYDIPTTWDELETLIETMKADGIPPWCVGIGSGDATGWPFTDWMEDVMLRMYGVEVYDQWVNHEIPFNDPKVAEVTQFVADMWFEEGNVLGGRDIISQTGFQESGLPVLDGECGLHKQSNFITAQFIDAGATLGDDLDVFYLPTMSDEFGQVVLGSGVHIVPFSDRDEVMQVVEYVGTPEYANARIASDVGGFLSPNTNHDTGTYTRDVERTLAEILVSADPFRFDASDLMPGEVGSGEWWRAGTDYVSGSITLEEFLDNTEAAWPDDA